MRAPASAQRKMGFLNRWANRIVITALFLYIGGHAIAMAGDDPCAPLETRLNLTTERMQETAQQWNDFVVGVTLNTEPPSPVQIAKDSKQIVEWAYKITKKAYAVYVAIRDKDLDAIRGKLLMQSPTPGGCTPITPPCETIAGDTGGKLATSGIAIDITRNAAEAAGFTGPDLEIAVAIAGAESSYKPDARSPRNSNGSYDHGLWQINSIHKSLLASGDWRLPKDNAKMAYSVWLEAGGAWTPWSSFKSGAFKTYLPGGDQVAKGCIDVVPGVETATRWAQRQTTTTCTALVAGAWNAANTPLPDMPTDLLAAVSPLRETEERPGDIRFTNFVNGTPAEIGLILPRGELISAPCTGGPVTTTSYDYRGDARYGRVKPTAREEQQIEIVDANWGSHPNGQIPESTLCAPKSAPDQLLRCNAAAAFDKLNAAYAQKFGRGIAVTDSYRTLAEQVDLKRRKPDLAATPGTSEHGAALAVDLGGGINNFETPQYKWMAANAPSFGWINPSWAKQGGSRPESWHWQYVVPQVAG